MRAVQQTWLVLLFGFMAAETSVAAHVQVITAERTGESDVTPVNGRYEPARVTHSRTALTLVYPLEMNAIGGTVVPRFLHFYETRSEEFIGENGAHRAPLPGTLSVAAAGAAYLPSKKTSFAPQWGFSLMRYGSLRSESYAPPMNELVIGATLFNLAPKPEIAEGTETQIALRVRSFPHAERFLPIVGHRMETVEGWFVDARFPSHIIVGWRDLLRNYTLSGGLLIDGREYPARMAEGSAWVEGYTTTVYVGGLRRIYDLLYVGLEIGTQREKITAYDREGQRIADFTTAFAPTAKISLDLITD